MIQSRNSMSAADQQRLNTRRKYWIHPRKPKLKLPRKTVAALALIESGIHDLERIAAAVGLAVSEILTIDSAADRSVRQLSIEGIPPGEYFPLLETVRCPGCGAGITVAPCVACRLRSK